jgi:hypothetical protein
LLSGGFEDSSIHLWSLTPKKLVKPKNKICDISKITLAPGKSEEKKSNAFFPDLDQTPASD